MVPTATCQLSSRPYSQSTTSCYPSALGINRWSQDSKGQYKNSVMLFVLGICVSYSTHKCWLFLCVCTIICQKIVDYSWAQQTVILPFLPASHSDRTVRFFAKQTRKKTASYWNRKESKTEHAVSFYSSVTCIGGVLCVTARVCFRVCVVCWAWHLLTVPNNVLCWNFNHLQVQNKSNAIRT